MILLSCPDSGHAHRVELLLSMLELEYELRDVSLRDGQHRTAEFRAINPWGQIPVLIDGPTIVSESNAILGYLARRERALTWLPTDPLRAAGVDRWLAKAAGELAFGISAARLIVRFGQPGDLALAQKRGRKLLAVADEVLSEAAFLTGDLPTIADLAIYSYAALSPEAVSLLTNLVTSVAGLRPLRHCRALFLYGD